jgi:outer membrane protein assembly factor BamE (lipoprotein component of BamABCDE complex)
MMPSLLRKHPLKGMARNQVIALLGEPSDTQKWPDANLIYVLGNDGTSIPIDNEWLLIKMGKDGRVVSWRRAKD